MVGPVKAVIFDMDGVLVDSEPLWRRAMVKGFCATGIEFTEEDCRKTTGKRFNEVVSHWIAHHSLHHVDPAGLEHAIIEDLLALIDSEAGPMEGAPDLIDFCLQSGLKTGLATSSSNNLMHTVLKKLNLSGSFQALTSAEHLSHGKPHPEVFLKCAAELGVRPQNCLVIEDSLNGVIAARAAQMQVIAVPDNEHRHLKGFAVADYLCHNMHEAREVLAGLLKA